MDSCRTHARDHSAVGLPQPAYSAFEGDTCDKFPWVNIQGRQAFLDALELYLAPVDDPELDERIAVRAAVARTIPLTCPDRFDARTICAQFMLLRGDAIEADELVEEAREADRLAMQGWTNIEIAGEINMSRSSVALSISRILHKLRIRAVNRSLTSSTTDASARCPFVRSCPDRRAPREQETVRKLLVRCQVMAPDQQFAHSGERGGAREARASREVPVALGSAAGGYCAVSESTYAWFSEIHCSTIGP